MWCKNNRRVLHLPPPISSTPGPSSHTPAPPAVASALLSRWSAMLSHAAFNSQHMQHPSRAWIWPHKPTSKASTANSSHKTASTQPLQPAVSQPLDTPPATSSRLPGLSFLDFPPSRAWIWGTLRLTLYITRFFTLCHISVSPLTYHRRREKKHER